jgi:hypothetical protein
VPANFTVVIRRPDDAASSGAVTFMEHSRPPPSFDVPPTVIPTSLPGMLSALGEHAATARSMVNDGAFGTLYLPATHRRELVMALAQRSVEKPAVLQELMRATWQLHLAGDLGTPSEIRQAADVFDAAVSAVAAAFAR